MSTVVLETGTILSIVFACLLTVKFLIEQRNKMKRLKLQIDKTGAVRMQEEEDDNHDLIEKVVEFADLF